MDKADQNGITGPITTDPIYKAHLELDSDGGREVYMVGQGEPPTDQTTEEITREAKEEMARVAWLAQEATGRKHKNLQDNLGSFGYGAPSGGHHPKYNQRCLAVRE
jgi:hypothetical protein